MFRYSKIFLLGLIFVLGAGLGHAQGGDFPLHEAAKNGKLGEALDTLGSPEAKIKALSKKDEAGMTPLHYFMINSEDCSESLYYILAQCETSSWINEVDQNGCTPLHKAVSLGKKFYVYDILLRGNADINKGDKDGNTPLCEAVKNGFDEIVKLLLEYGADINDPTLYEASDPHSLSYDTVALLFEYGKRDDFIKNIKDSVDLSDENGETLLHQAISHNHLEMVKCLLSVVGIDVNVDSRIDYFNEENKTPLNLAVEMGNVKIVKLLLEKGAKANDAKLYKTYFDGESYCDYNIIALLFEHGTKKSFSEKIDNIKAVVKNKDKHGMTLLHYAVLHNYSKLVGRLLSVDGIDVNAPITREDGTGETLLYIAVKLGFKDIIEQLLNAGADANTQCETPLGTETPLRCAVRLCRADLLDYEIIKRLLKCEDDINQPLESGKTPLFAAIDNSDSELVEILLDNGASLGEVIYSEDWGAKAENSTRVSRHSVKIKGNCFNKTPLSYAVELYEKDSSQSYLEIVRLLLQHGADAETLLNAAVNKSNLKRVKTLVNGGAKVSEDCLQIARRKTSWKMSQYNVCKKIYKFLKLKKKKKFWSSWC